MSARDRLVSAIAFALTRCKSELREMAQKHNTDEARVRAARKIADHITQSNLKVSEGEPAKPHSIGNGPKGG